MNASPAFVQDLIAYILRKQSEPDRRMILAVIAEMAAEQTQPETREFLERFPQNIGLIDPADG